MTRFGLAVVFSCEDASYKVFSAALRSEPIENVWILMREMAYLPGDLYRLGPRNLGIYTLPLLFPS
jgi:hypothetical protein